MTAASRAALRVLRAGSVPDDGIQLLTVGAHDLIDLTRTSLRSLRGKANPAPMFLKGEWGTGKTHSIRLVRALALEGGFATMEAVLNSRTCPPNYPQRMLPIMTRNMAYGDERGIRSVVGSLLHDDKKAGHALSTNWDKAQADIWHAASTLRALSSQGETALLGTSGAWRILTGTDIAHSDYGYRRLKALYRLQWTTAFVRSLGAKGTVLLFDELETIDQLWNSRSRATAYDALGAFLEAPNTWCVFGITERFLRVVYADSYSDAFHRASPAGRRFLSIWRHGEAELVAPPRIGDMEAEKLAEVVQSLYHSAYPEAANCSADCRGAIADWSRNAARNPRRLVRAIIDTCDRARPLETLARMTISTPT